MDTEITNYLKGLEIFMIIQLFEYSLLFFIVGGYFFMDYMLKTPDKDKKNNKDKDIDKYKSDNKGNNNKYTYSSKSKSNDKKENIRQKTCS